MKCFRKKGKRIFKIWGREAYAAMLNVEQDENRQFIEDIDNVMDGANIE